MKDCGLERNLVEAVQPSTEALLDFNDKYLATDDLQALTVDLSTMVTGWRNDLSLRIKMIEVLHNAHVPALLEGSQTNSVQ